MPSRREHRGGPSTRTARPVRARRRQGRRLGFRWPRAPRGRSRPEEESCALIAASASLGSPLVVALLAVLVLVELGLLAWALIDLARRPADRVAGGSRLLWLLLCLLVQLIGPVIYLIVGRLRAAPRRVPPPRAPGGDGHVARAAAALYDAAGPGARQARTARRPRPRRQPLRRAAGPPSSSSACSKVFRSTAALDGLSLSVPEGSVFGFLGPNGAGKTTTLRILAGLARPTSGAAHVLGHDVAGAGGDVRALVGFLPDVPAFYKWMTAPQYLRFAGSLFGLRGDVLEARVAALLDLAGLAGVEHAHRRLLARHEAAPRRGPGAGQRAPPAAARRAHQRPRPHRPPRSARHGRGPARPHHRVLLDAHPRRRGTRLRHRGHHRPRARGRARAHRRASPAARRAQPPGRRGGRAAAPRGGARGRRLAARASRSPRTAACAWPPTTSRRRSASCPRWSRVWGSRCAASKATS